MVSLLALIGLSGLVVGGAMLGLGDMILNTAKDGDESSQASNLGAEQDRSSGSYAEAGRNEPGWTGGSSTATEVPTTPGSGDSVLVDSSITLVDSNARLVASDVVSGTQPPALVVTETPHIDPDVLREVLGADSFGGTLYPSYPSPSFIEGAEYEVAELDTGTVTDAVAIVSPVTLDTVALAPPVTLDAVAMAPPIATDSVPRVEDITLANGDVIQIRPGNIHGYTCQPVDGGDFACMSPDSPSFDPEKTPTGLAAAYGHDPVMILRNHLRNDEVQCAISGSRDDCDPGWRTREIANGEAVLLDEKLFPGPLDDFLRGGVNALASTGATLIRVETYEDLWDNEVRVAEAHGGWGWYTLHSVLATPETALNMAGYLLVTAPNEIIDACITNADAEGCGGKVIPIIVEVLGTKGAGAGAGVVRTAIRVDTPPTGAIVRVRADGRQAIIDRGAMDPDSVYAGVIDAQGNLLVRNTSSTPNLELGLYPRTRTHAIIADEFADDANLLGFTVFPLEDGRLMVRYKSASINERRRDSTNPELTDPRERALINNRLEELTGREVLDGHDFAGMVDQDALIRGTWNERWTHLDSDLHTHIDTNMAHNSQIAVPKDMLEGRSRAELEIYLGTREGRWAIGENADGTTFLIRGNPTDLPGDVRLVYENSSGIPLGPTIGSLVQGKAAMQVTPGVRVVHGQHVNDLGRVEPWTAHYDEYGRLEARTDYNAGNSAHGIDPIHHHTYEWGPGMSPLESTSHVPGPWAD